MTLTLINDSPKLLDAAESCLRRYGLAKTSIEDVARAAGVSRATVYRQIGNRDALLKAMMTREAKTLAQNAAAHLEGVDNIGDWIVEGIIYCHKAIPNMLVLSAFLIPQEIGVVNQSVLPSERMLAVGADMVRPVFEAAQGADQLQSGIDVDETVEWVVRILVSFLSISEQRKRSETEFRALLQRMLLPSILKPTDTNKG